MIILSVAHSEGTGAYNTEIKVDEYKCSQIMTKACADILGENKQHAVIIDAGKSSLHQYKKMKKEYISKERPKLALEIHLNSCNDETVNYSSCFYNGKNKRTKEFSDRIISNFQLAMFNKMSHGFKSIGLPSEGYDINRFWFITDLLCDSIIVEPCFLSNNAQAKKLLDPMFLHGIGCLVGEAIITCLTTIG